MSVYDASQAIANPGRLIVGPTQGALVTGLPLDATGKPTYGGTPVGIVSAAAIEIDEESVDVVSEARAKRTGKVIGVTRAALAFVLTQYDKTVLNSLYAFTTTSGGGFSGANTFRLPDPGRNLHAGFRTAGAPLLFAADNPANPSFIVHAPIYTHGEAKKRIDNVLNRPREEAVLVIVGEDASGLDLSCDLLDHLSLT